MRFMKKLKKLKLKKKKTPTRQLNVRIPVALYAKLKKSGYPITTIVLRALDRMVA